MVYADDGRVLLVNRAWTTTTGYAAEELTTLPEWTRRAYGARAAMMNTVIGALFALTESVDNGEREITTASGEKRIWHFITAPLGRDERRPADAGDERDRRHRAAPPRCRRRRQRSADAPGDGRRRVRRLGVGPAERRDDLERQDARAARHRPGRAGQLRAVPAPHPPRRPRAARARDHRGVDQRRPRQRVPHRPARRRGALAVVARPGRSAAPTAASACSASSATSPSRRTWSPRCRTPTAGRTSSSPRSRTSCATRSRRCATRSAILQRSRADATTFDKAAGVMERQLGQLVRLIDDLLDVSRLSLDKLTLRVEVTDLAAIVEHAVEACRPAAERAGHVLEVSVPEEPVRLYGDRARLAQVFANLLGNACKFTPDGGRIVVVGAARGRVGRGLGQGRRHRHRRRRDRPRVRDVRPGRPLARALARRSRHRPDAGAAAGRDARRQRRRDAATGSAAAASSSSRCRSPASCATSPRPPSRADGRPRRKPRRRRRACRSWSSTTTATAPTAWRCCSRSPATRRTSRATARRRWRAPRRCGPRRSCSTSACPA